MRKITSIITLLILMLTACGKDENIKTQTPVTSVSIIGTWDSQPVTYTSPFSASFSSIPIQGNINGNSSEENYAITFTENPNQISSVGTFSFNVLATITSPSGPPYSQSIQNFEFPLNGTWTRNGNQLEIFDGTQTTIATIVELTNTSLKLSFSPEDFNIQQYLGNSLLTNFVLYDNVELSFIKI